MSMTEKKFGECLMLYGAAIENWPEEIQAEAIQATHQSAISALMIEQRYFEQLLRDHDVIEPANPWLADRIINAAASRASRVSVTAWLQEVLTFMLPRPAFAFAAVLAIGIVIGFSLPAEYNATPAPFEDAAL